MKCPKCGSDKIQFGTNTSGGGFSVGDACCGYICVGPLGLLCGACGSGTETEEFWICQNCGRKFSTNEGKIKAEEVSKKQQNYAENKTIRDAIFSQYGSLEEYKRHSNELYNYKLMIDNQYNAELKKYLDSNLSTDADLRKLNKKLSKTRRIIILVLELLLLFAGLALLALEFVISGFIIGGIALTLLFTRWESIDKVKEQIMNKFAQTSPSASQLCQEKVAADNNYKQSLKNIAKIEACLEYEQQTQRYN